MLIGLIAYVAVYLFLSFLAGGMMAGASPAFDYFRQPYVFALETALSWLAIVGIGFDYAGRSGVNFRTAVATGIAIFAYHASYWLLDFESIDLIHDLPIAFILPAGYRLKKLLQSTNKK